MLKPGNQKLATMGMEIIITEEEIGNLNKMKKKWSTGSRKNSNMVGMGNEVVGKALLK